jgi:hypothetical protein
VKHVSHFRFLMRIIFVLASICLLRLFSLNISEEGVTVVGYALGIDDQQASQTQW